MKNFLLNVPLPSYVFLSMSVNLLCPTPLYFVRYRCMSIVSKCCFVVCVCHRSLTFSCPLCDVGDICWFLSFTQVFVGSPADGELHRGDVIVAIDNYDATSMVHRQAMDLIKRAGGSLSLRIQT